MPDIWNRKYQEFGARCVYCGKDLFGDVDAYMGTVLDHIVPWSVSKDDSEGNKVLSCAICNSLKGSFDPREGRSGVSRHELIERARAKVFEVRAKKVREFCDYLSKYRGAEPGATDNPDDAQRI